LNTDVINQQLIEELIHELIVGSHETEVVLSKDQARYVPRLTLGHHESLVKRSEPSDKDTCTQLKFSQPGQLRNLQWQLVKSPALSADEVEIEVEATGLNFRDVMYAQGLLSDEAIENGFAGPTIGLECSGKITRVGQAVTRFAVDDRSGFSYPTQSLCRGGSNDSEHLFNELLRTRTHGAVGCR
jgi:hypothetical protein